MTSNTCIVKHATINVATEDGVERHGPGRAPTAFRIWRAGENVADDGSIYFTEESAAKLIDEQASRARPYSIDFDHLSLAENRPAMAGRAAGYHELEVRAGELWAVNVEWCADVRTGLEQDPPHWRYFSPAFLVDAETKAVTSYVNLALCINPMTHGIPLLASKRSAIAKSASRKTEAGMSTEEQLSLLDAQIEATEDADLKAALTAAREALAAKKTDEEEVVADAEKKDDDEDEKKKKKDEEEKKEAAAPVEHAARGDDVTSLTKKVMELERRAEVSEIDALLAKHAGLPEEFKRHCRTQSLETARANIAAVTKHAAARPSKPTQGSTDAGDTLDPRIGDEMDRQMGIKSPTAIMPKRLEDGRFVMHNVRPSDLARFNAQKVKL